MSYLKYLFTNQTGDVQYKLEDTSFTLITDWTPLGIVPIPQGFQVDLDQYAPSNLLQGWITWRLGSVESIPEEINRQAALPLSGLSDPLLTLYTRLGITPAQVPVSNWTIPILVTTRLLLKNYPVLDPIESLSSEDQSILQFVVGLLVACKVRPFLPKTGSTGEMTTIQVGTTQFSFSDPVKPTMGIEDGWYIEAWDALGVILGMDSIWDAIRDTPLFVAVGRTRSRDRSGIRVPQGAGMLMTLLANEEFELLTKGPIRWPSLGISNTHF